MRSGAPRHTFPWREWGPVIILALLPALPLLLGSGLVNTRAGGDSPFLLVRVQQMVLNLRAGTFPVRWMPQAAYGLGYPFFNFYASLPYYLAAMLKLLGLGYIASIKLTQTLGFVFAAMAVYALSRELGHPRSANLLVALAYSCAPFHLINVYVRGDSLSEFYAFVFFPLILWALLCLQRRPGVHSAAAVALSYAGLVVTHNLSAFIFTPFVLLYALWLAVRKPFFVRTLLRSFLALAVGVLLSAWFWLPALAERSNVSFQDMTTGYFHYALHFRDASLVQHSLLFDWAITADKQPFSMGLLQATLAMAGLAAIFTCWIRRRHVEVHSAFLVLLLAISTFMITSLSRPLWDHLPLLPLVQFPWRFLSVQALATSLLIAYLVPQRPRWKTLLPLLLGLAVLACTLGGLRPERLFIHEGDVTAQRLAWYEYFTANVGTTIRTDWLPRWVDPRPYTSEVLQQLEEGKPAPLVLEGQATATQLGASQSTYELWAIEVETPKALLAFHTYYYPGWEARVDGRPAQIEALPGLGYIGLRLSQGQHQVSLRLARTPAQRIAEVVSALAAVVLLSLLARAVRWDWRTIGAIAALCAALIAGILLVQGLSAATVEGRLDLTMDFDRIPYLHHNPQGVRFGDAARLTGYDVSSESVSAGDTLTLTTYWNNVQCSDCVVRLALVSPAQHLFAVPYVIASSEKAINAGAIQHALPIPSSTMRGIYLLNLCVYNPEGEVSPVTTRGETLGSTYLLPVRVSGEGFADANTPLLQRFGERIALSAVQTRQQTPGTLEITATWRVFASPPQNYKAALRLRDPAGWEVARLDTQPGYGFYPTSMWRPGELVYDRYSLPLDDGTAPGSNYSLEVTLYEAASLRLIGTARIANVAVTQPTVRQGYPVLHTFGFALALSEAQLPKVEAEQGETLPLLLKWAAMAGLDQDYQCLISVLNLAGASVISQTMPLADEYPTSQWTQDAVVASRFPVRLAPDLPAGQYRIAVTVVEVPSGEEVGTFLLPTPLQVREAARNFTIPPMQTPVGADFGAQVRLLGYDLQRTDRELRLTLHWQALTAMRTDYKLFVHLFDPTTEKIVAQQDVLAGGDSHPMTRWVPTEVVSDHVILPLQGVPSGAYRLAVGLYHLDGRLPIVAPAGFTVSAHRLLLSEAISVP